MLRQHNDIRNKCSTVYKVVPEVDETQDTCDGEFISSDCVEATERDTYLQIREGDSMTTVIQKISDELSRFGGGGCSNTYQIYTDHDGLRLKVRKQGSQLGEVIYVDWGDGYVTEHVWEYQGQIDAQYLYRNNPIPRGTFLTVTVTAQDGGQVYLVKLDYPD